MNNQLKLTLKQLPRLTLENARQLVGRDIIFKTDGDLATSTILGVNDKSIEINNHPKRDNNLSLDRVIRVLPAGWHLIIDESSLHITIDK